jgi:hypothetical protein
MTSTTMKSRSDQRAVIPAAPHTGGETSPEPKASANGKDHGSADTAVDLAQAARFLSLLDPEATSFTFQTFDDDKKRKRGSLVRIFHGTLDEHAAELTRLNDCGAGVFVTVNETNGKGRAAGCIRRVRAAFVDLDGPPLGPVLAWERKPHVVVESSPQRWHAYYLGNEKIGDFAATQKSLAARFGATRSVEAGDEADLHGIGPQQENNRNGLGRCFRD